MDTWRGQAQTGQIWWVFVVRGVLAAMLGVFALMWPTLIVEILVLLVGAYLIADGVMSVVITIRRAAAAGRMLQPLISVLVGLLLVLWPGESARTLIVVMGAAALFIGISYVVTARRFGVDAMDRQLMTGAMEQTARWERLNDDLVQLSRIEGGIGLENVGPVDLGRQLCRLGLLMRRPCLKGY